MRYVNMRRFSTTAFIQVRDQTRQSPTIGIASQSDEGSLSSKTTCTDSKQAVWFVVCSVFRTQDALRLTNERNPGNVRGNSQPGQMILAVPR